MKRKPPTKNDLKKWLKAHGHKDIDMASVDAKSRTPEFVVALHQKEKPIQ